MKDYEKTSRHEKDYHLEQKDYHRAGVAHRDSLLFGMFVEKLHEVINS
jgi:hypothetical protein